MIDIGVNLANPMFYNDLDAVLYRAAEAGVEGLIAIGTSVQTSEDILLLSACPQYIPIWTTSGIHPHAASTATPCALSNIRALSLSKQCIAIGETGLDYHRMLSLKKEQHDCFYAHIAFAHELKKPLYLHCRDAFLDMHAILSCETLKAVVHCFTGTKEEARAWLDLGYDLGITGWLTQGHRSLSLQEALDFIPIDRIHIETDAPYLLPSTAQRIAPTQKMKTGWRCEPMHLPLVLKAVADYKKMDASLLKEQLWLNNLRFFGKALSHAR